MGVHNSGPLNLLKIRMVLPRGSLPMIAHILTILILNNARHRVTILYIAASIKPPGGGIHTTFLLPARYRSRTIDDRANVGAVSFLCQLGLSCQVVILLPQGLHVFDLGLSAIDVHAQEVRSASGWLLAVHLTGG